MYGISPSGGQPKLILRDLRNAAVSPDGKTLALWRATGSGGDAKASVWISSPPGAAARAYRPAPFELPFDPPGSSLRFSPDGKSLLLVTAGVAPQVWLLPFPESSGTPRRLFANLEFGSPPQVSWLPDSRHAVMSFATGSALSALWMADPERGELRQLTAGTSSDVAPSVSPRGDRIVFTAISEDYDLLSLPLDGSAPHKLSANSRNVYSPSWSPDGNQLLYATDRTGDSEIWVHNQKADLDRPLVTARDFTSGTTTALADPVFSPDGSRFAFVRFSAEDPPNIWVEPSVGGPLIRLSREYMVAPAWSPDGNSISGLMQRGRPWQPAIVGVGADMTARPIPVNVTCLTALEWSAAGDWLACEARDGVQLFSPDGARQRKLPALHAAALTFSHDGKTLYGVAREGSRTLLKTVDLGSGEARTLAEFPGGPLISARDPYQVRIRLAPDGRSLATSARTVSSDLWLLGGYPRPGRWWQFWL